MNWDKTIDYLYIRAHMRYRVFITDFNLEFVFFLKRQMLNLSISFFFKHFYNMECNTKIFWEVTHLNTTLVQATAEF